MEFDDMQTEWIMREICCGLEHGVDIAVYADPKVLTRARCTRFVSGLSTKLK